MSSFEVQRTSVRILASIPVHLEVCDPESLKTLSEPFAARIVDLSAGGARLEMEGLSQINAELFAPGITVHLRFEPPEIRLKSKVYLTIAWFRSPTEQTGRVAANVGGHFKNIIAEDIAALLRYASAHQTPHAGPSPVPHPKLPWLLTTVSLLALTGAVLHDLGLQTKVAELTQSVARLGEQLQSQKATPAPLPVVRDVHLVAPPIPAASPPPRSVPAAEPVRAEPVRPSAGSLQFELTEKVPGTDLASLEVMGSDLVGAVLNQSPLAQEVGVDLEFACASTDSGAEGRCLCQIPLIRIAAKGRADFSCAPAVPLPLGLGLVKVRIHKR